MKLNKLLGMLAMGLGLIACTDNNLVGNDDQHVVQKEGSTYVAFALDFNDANTRADGTQTNATEEESYISSAYVIMANGEEIEAIVGMNDTNEDAGNYYDTTTKQYLFSTSSGNHDFYVVVNPETIPTEETSIETYFQTEQPLNITTIASNNGEGNFMMSSCKKETFYLKDNVTKEQAIAGTNGIADNHFSIEVERVAAKITMTCENETLTDGKTQNPTEVGTISNLKFYLQGQATKSYRMANGNLNLTHDKLTYIGSDEIGTSNKNGNGISINIGNNKTAATPVYCLENLQDEYWQKNTTYVVLSTQFIPKTVVDCTNGTITTNTQTSPESFYVVESGELAMNYILKSDLDTFQDGDETKLPEGVESISEEYVNGQCWFGPIWVGQSDTTPQKGPVKRNTWYNLAITSIALPGKSSMPEVEPEPEIPLVPDTHVAITLTVKDWEVVDRTVSLK
ncbi:Mfa1 family fimbria major subunit [Phocaeicola barnesiae]|uniref:Mfa1 family fimbria major subunit n=1 Tax=Phocaeicola barnesiae TaxID=376804 RepID=UPI0025A3777E|nr:Mfa1 family fimbria major subunit [Phocaeicola barnesiae]MDM8309597.1 Mfa1 family fimbria major subunit [Phocaeicola barnesiae]